MFIPLPDDWSSCPAWWKFLVDEVAREARPQGIFPSNSPKWDEFLDKRLREQGIIFEYHNGVNFISEEDFLVLKLRHGI